MLFGVSNRLFILSRTSQFDEFLQAKLELECALQHRVIKMPAAWLETLALILRRAVLFSLHQARASVQLCLARASSMRRMSMNKSISTRVCRQRVCQRRLHQLDQRQ